jgi:hypothetical protein
MQQGGRQWFSKGYPEGYIKLRPGKKGRTWAGRLIDACIIELRQREEMGCGWKMVRFFPAADGIGHRRTGRRHG